MSLTKFSRSIAGNIAIVTGAASGMGEATAKLFANEGALVAAIDVNEEGLNRVVTEICAEGKTAKGWILDLSNGEEIRRVFNEIADDFGGIDILVNNAGIGGQGLTIEEIDEAAFDAMVAVNLKGSFFATQAVVPGMKQRSYGKIINISSNFAMGGAAFASHYAACKSGLSGLHPSCTTRMGK